MLTDATSIEIRFQEVSLDAWYLGNDDRYWVMLDTQEPRHYEADLWASPAELASAIYLAIKGRAPDESRELIEDAEAFMERVERQADLQNEAYVPHSLRFIP